VVKECSAEVFFEYASFQEKEFVVKKGNEMNSKGQVSVADFGAVLILLMIAFPWFIIIGTVFNVMFPLIANQGFTHYGIMVGLLQLVPVEIIMLILIYPYLSSQARKQGGFNQGF
jgi:hypothetical protein